MSISVISAENGYVVIGTEDPILARSILVETLIERDELDTFGVCTVYKERGYCDLQTDDLCEACLGFLNTILPPDHGVPLPTVYWKEL